MKKGINGIKRALSLLLALLLLSAALPAAVFADDGPAKLDAESALLMDMSTGRILYEKDKDAVHFPASTTKMITAILAIENLTMDRVMTADAEVAKTGGDTINLKTGEQITVEQALNALLVKSANDCAVILAKAVSGEVSDFVELMNAKAKEIGCENTRFVTPNGLHDEEHVSTCEDLAKIALYCMKNEIFRSIVCKDTYTVPVTNMSPARELASTNLMLWETTPRIYINNKFTGCKYEGTIGIKTGYTSHAQGCLVAACEREGTTLLAVVMMSTSYGRFADCIKLFNWGFSKYRTLPIFEAGRELGVVKVKRGEFNKVKAVLSEDVCATVPVEAADSVITTSVELDGSVRAPFEAGTVIGTVNIYEAGELISTFAAIAASGVAKGGILSVFGIEDHTAKIIGYVIVAALMILIGSFVIWVIIKRRETRIKKARKAARIKAKREEEARKRLEWDRRYESRYLGPGEEGPDRGGDRPGGSV